MLTVWPVTSRVVASGTQTIAGIPYSRATVSAYRGAGDTRTSPAVDDHGGRID